MQHIDTLLFPRWTVVVDDQNRILEHHAIAIDGGKIINVLPHDEATTQYDAAKTVYLHDHVLMPGLVNAHAHSPMALLRGLADDLPLMTWLEEHIWPAENKWLSDEFVYDGAQLALAEMLRSGTTCVNEHYSFPLPMAKATLKAGLRINLGLFVIDAKTAWNADAAECLAQCESIIERFKDTSQVTTCLAPHAPYTVSDDTFKKMAGLAEQHALGMHIHMHETAFEVAQSMEKHHCRPLQRFLDLGLLNERAMLVHMTQIEDADIALLKASAASVVTCPHSNMKLASGICPLDRLDNAGINIAIGTDSAASNNSLDMFAEMRIAALLAKVSASDSTTIPAEKALRMATIQGAKALGLDDKIGSIEVGKEADLIAINMDDLCTQPTHTIPSHLVYALNSRQVSDVWVAGKRLLADRRFTTIDEQAVLGKTKEWQKRLA